jgi:cyclic pyranopterin monophosphate synthase
MSELSHVDLKGRAKMVDVGGKPVQKRTAKAGGKIFMAASTLDLIKDNQIKKGDVLTLAQIAGIQAAKNTPHLIPLCHMLLLHKVDVELSIVEDGILAVSLVKSSGQTGVEMEAITAVSIALLTVYDMCKGVDKNMHIGEIKLIEKVKEDV